MGFYEKPLKHWNGIARSLPEMISTAVVEIVPTSIQFYLHGSYADFTTVGMRAGDMVAQTRGMLALAQHLRQPLKS